jgi:hypothetical protein
MQQQRYAHNTYERARVQFSYLLRPKVTAWSIIPHLLCLGLTTHGVAVAWIVAAAPDDAGEAPVPVAAENSSCRSRSGGCETYSWA